MLASAPEVSVVVCTRNRGSSAVMTICSILEIGHPDCEVILVDQSTNRDTEQAVQSFFADPRFRYLPSGTIGAGQARNIGIACARGKFIACTDDDCQVPANWLAVLVDLFHQNPRVGVIFTNVIAAEHNANEVFIPAYVTKKDRLVRTMWEKCAARGMGASMAFRKEALDAFGAFDVMLGPGAPFPACEEGDLAVRAILRGWWVYETNQTAVVHYGARTYLEGKELARRNWIGIGAAYAKPLKCGYWHVVPVILYEALYMGLFSAIPQLLRLQKPSGVKRFVYFLIGFVKGLQTPVDRQRIFYRHEGNL